MLVQMSLQAGLEQVSALVAVIFANHDHILFRKSLGQLRYGNRRAGYGLDHGGMIVGLWWRRFRPVISGMTASDNVIGAWGMKNRPVLQPLRAALENLIDIYTMLRIA